MTPEQIKALIEETLKAALATQLAEALKSDAVTGHFTKVAAAQATEALKKAGLTGPVGDVVSEAVKKATEAAAAAGAGTGTGAGAGTGTGAGAVAGAGTAAGAGAGESVELKKLQEKIANLEAQNKRAEEARVASELKAREQTRDVAIRDALSKAGFPAERIPHILPYLHSTGRIKIDEAGTPVMTFQRAGYSEDLAIDAAMAEFAKTPDGKVYLPPVGASGTGGGAGERNDTGGGHMVTSPDQLLAMILN